MKELIYLACMQGRVTVIVAYGHSVTDSILRRWSGAIVYGLLVKKNWQKIAFYWNFKRTLLHDFIQDR